MNSKKLGRGLDALLSEEDEATKKESSDKYLSEIEINLVKPNINQPRKYFDENEIAVLTETIKREGVVQPIIVRKINETYEIIAGERRWRAAKLANLKTIPSIVINADDDKALILSLIENIHRSNLSPVEKANTFKAILEKKKCTQEELAKQLSMDRSSIANFIRILELPAEIQDYVSRGTISMGHARALLSVSDSNEQKTLANKIIKYGMSVRKLENTLKLKSGINKKSSFTKDPLFNEISNKLSEFFGTKVVLIAGKKRGRILIDYFDNSQLNEILKRLGIVV